MINRRNTYKGNKPHIIIFIQIKLYYVIIGKTVFFCKIPECSTVEATDPLAGSKPYKSVLILQGMVNYRPGQSIFYSKLFVCRFLAIQSKGGNDQKQNDRVSHANG